MQTDATLQEVKKESMRRTPWDLLTPMIFINGVELKAGMRRRR